MKDNNNNTSNAKERIPFSFAKFFTSMNLEKLARHINNVRIGRYSSPSEFDLLIIQRNFGWVPFDHKYDVNLANDAMTHIMWRVVDLVLDDHHPIMQIEIMKGRETAYKSSFNARYNGVSLMFDLWDLVLAYGTHSKFAAMLEVALRRRMETLPDEYSSRDKDKLKKVFDSLEYALEHHTLTTPLAHSVRPYIKHLGYGYVPKSGENVK